MILRIPVRPPLTASLFFSTVSIEIFSFAFVSASPTLIELLYVNVRAPIDVLESTSAVIPINSIFSGIQTSLFPRLEHFLCVFIKDLVCALDLYEQDWTPGRESSLSKPYQLGTQTLSTIAVLTERRLYIDPEDNKIIASTNYCDAILPSM